MAIKIEQEDSAINESEDELISVIKIEDNLKTEDVIFFYVF